MDWEPLVAPPQGPDVGLGKDLLSVLRDEKYAEYKDFIIVVDSEEFKVHKLLLIAVSDFFKALLEADMVEKSANHVDLKGLDPLVVGNIIEYLYTAKITGARAPHKELLATADYLQIAVVTEMLAKTLADEVDVNNCFTNLSLLEEYACVGAVRNVKEYIRSHLDDILQAHGVNGLCYESFTHIVQQWGGSEWHLFRTIKNWANDDRKQHVNDLMHQVRFRLMSPEKLQSIIEMDMYSDAGGPWTSLVDSAVMYQNLPAHRKVLHESVQSEVRGEATPVGLSTYSGANALGKDGKWRKFPTQGNPDLSEGVAATVAINNYLVVCAAFSEIQEFHIFDPRTLKWAPMARMSAPRIDFTLVHDGRYIYVLGGCTDGSVDSITDRMERYNFETDSWSIMSTTLPIPWCELLACQLSGLIYVTSGFTTGSSQFLHRLDCYNPTADSWESKAPMIEKRPVYAMNPIKLAAEEFFVIMCDAFIMQYYNPRTNQWSLWTSFSSLHSDLRTTPAEPEQELTMGRIIAKDDTVFLLGFSCEVEWRDTDDHVIVMDVYQCCKEWKLHPGSRYVTERDLNVLPSGFGTACGVLSIPPAVADDEAEVQAD